VPRRVSLPTADDLFHNTRQARKGREPGAAARTIAAHPERTPLAPVAEKVPAEVEQAVADAPRKKAPSGRVRHDEKMTVYVTADELLDIEHARLSLRRDQGLAVDRGRLVREAIAIVLADLEANGDGSVLVQRLNGR
jgi:hypothetical protein